MVVGDNTNNGREFNNTHVIAFGLPIENKRRVFIVRKGGAGGC
jgi:hypothetical protein